MGVNNMKIENDYPKIIKKVQKFVIFRKISLITFLLSTIICTIINLSVGGKKWMLYVLGGEVVFYYAFLNKPLIDNSFVKRLTVVVAIICAYLYMIDIIENTNWSYFVINIIVFSIIIIQLFLFFIEFKSQKKKFIPLFLTSIGSVIFFILAIANIVEINWPIIVLGSLGIVSLLILFVFNHNTIIKDLKKYYSVK